MENKKEDFEQRAFRLFFQKPGLKLFFGNIGTYKTSLILFLSKKFGLKGFYIATGKHIYDSVSIPTNLRLIKSKSLFSDLKIGFSLVRSFSKIIVIHDTLVANILTSRAFLNEVVIAKLVLSLLNLYRELGNKGSYIIIIDYINELTGKPVSWSYSKHYISSIVRSEINAKERTYNLTLLNRNLEELMAFSTSIEELKRELYEIIS